MSDIVERLKTMVDFDLGLYRQAADEIERLREQRDRAAWSAHELRAKLARAVEALEAYDSPETFDGGLRARRALVEIRGEAAKR